MFVLQRLGYACFTCCDIQCVIRKAFVINGRDNLEFNSRSLKLYLLKTVRSGESWNWVNNIIKHYMKNLGQLKINNFYLLITYGVCKKRKYCNRTSEKKNSLLLTKQTKKISVCLSVCLAVRTWTFHVDTITFEGVSGSKQNLVGVFYVWNIGLLLKSKVKSWSWSKSWSWTEFWFSQKLCGATPNLVDIFSI